MAKRHRRNGGGSIGENGVSVAKAKGSIESVISVTCGVSAISASASAKNGVAAAKQVAKEYRKHGVTKSAMAKSKRNGGAQHQRIKISSASTQACRSIMAAA